MVNNFSEYFFYEKLNPGFRNIFILYGYKKLKKYLALKWKFRNDVIFTW